MGRRNITASLSKRVIFLLPVIKDLPQYRKTKQLPSAETSGQPLPLKPQPEGDSQERLSWPPAFCKPLQEPAGCRPLERSAHYRERPLPQSSYFLPKARP